MTERLVAVIVTMHVMVITIDFIGAITVCSGRFSVARLRRWQQVYLSIVFGKSVSLILFKECPLTAAENWFRSRGDCNTAYDDSFIEYYIPVLQGEIDLVVTCLLMLAGFFAVARLANHQIRTCLATSRATPLAGSETLPHKD